MNAERVEAEQAPITMQGLMCSIKRVQFGVPLELVDKLIEYEVVPPPPLALPWIGGIGLYDKKVVMSITILRWKDPPPRRPTKGVLLKVPNSECSWALEVGAVASLVSAQVSQKSVRVGDVKLPAWITAANTEGRMVGWFNIEKMIEELSAVGD